MDKQKLLIIVPAVIVLVLLIVFGIDLARDLKTEKENRASSIEESLKESESESVRESQEEEASEAAEEHKEILSQLCTLVQEAGVQEDSSKEAEGLVFPYAIPDTGLVVEKVIPYSGHFLEDGSNDEVKDSVALILKNNGEDLETVTVRLMAEGKTLNFMASEVPVPR